MYIVPMRWVVALFITSMICSLLPACASIDTIVHGQSISSNQTLTSPGGNFILGFFTAGPSTSSYLGIWYNTTTTNITVVWVANRDAPLDSPGVFTLGIDGNFAVLDRTRKIIWSSNVSVSVSDTNATTGILGDDGNLNLQLGGKQLWQSFHYPSDTLLPGMKLKFNRRTGPKRFLTSWASIDDPRLGKFVLGIDTIGLTQYLLWEEGKPYWRSVIYQGTKRETIFQISKGNAYDISYNFDGDSFFVAFTTSDNTEQVRTLLTPTGQIDVLARSNSSSSWALVMQWPVFLWDFYNACGPNGASDYKSPSQLLCKCLTGFTPKNQKEWDTGNWTGGCVRKMELECGKREGFLKLRRIKLPDHVVFAGHSSITGCHSACLQKCSCTAYAYFNVSEEVMVKCMHWFGDLKDLVQNHTDGKDLYIRFQNITDDTNEVVVRNKNNLSLVIAIPIVATALLAFSVFGCWLCRKKWQEEEGGEQFLTENTAEDVPTLELAIFEFCSILAATDNFSETNKLGEGGFGPVYKGNLPGNQVVAIKRLSAQSGQGFQEYINELKLIAKLQHTNLVRLLGCCAEQNEKILIYEYMPNRSLDKFLFGTSQEGILDWGIRFRIVEGVAQGLLYLHKYSRLKIIHRDLKASNILLDGAMNPKISDFGMARYFGIEQTEANTNRVVGTYGYMSPEYALYGQFSEKSDVFSFGVLLLEIVSGKKNRDFHRSELYQTLLGWTWDLWKEGTGVDIIDPSIRDTCCSEEALRCIQIGLLCVQEDPVDRPTMHAVVAMLCNEAAQLPSPKEPAFSTRNAAGFSAQPSSSYSYNDMSVSISEPR